MAERREFSSQEPSAQSLASALNAKRTGKGWQARCPAHDDKEPSLSISEKNGRTLIKCHGRCSQDAVLDALRAKGLWPAMNAYRSRQPTAVRVNSVYDYHNEVGTTVFQVVRFLPKAFKQRRPDGRDGYIWNLEGIPVLPYRLPELQEAIATSRPVFIVEGEKDVDNLAKLGIVATCNAGGALKWRGAHAQFLRGGDVVVVPDNDATGKQHASAVAESLTGIAARIRLLKLSPLPDKGDVSDWLEAGGTAEQLWKLVEDAPDWRPTLVETNTAREEHLENRARLTFTLYRDIEPAPRKEWLCHNLFGAGELSCVFGQPGSCKSTLVGDFGAHAAAGMTWFGRATQKCGVLYVAAERAILVKRRMAAFRMYHSIDDIPLAVVGGQPDLRTSDADALQIIDCAKRLEDEYGIAVTLIILETVSRLLAGGDENSSKDMGALVRKFATVQEATNAHIMSVHHIPADGAPRLRGHGSLLGACDVTARTERHGSCRKLTIDKANDGPEGECIAFTLQSVQLSCHDKIKTIAPVIVPTELPAQPQSGPNLTPNQRTMLSILHAGGGAGLRTEELNEKAREAGLGTKRKADLYDLREGLKSKGLVHFSKEKWIASQ